MSDFYIASYSLDSDDTLQHYGVKGMRWGVRRYMNKDGTYKPRAYKKFGGKKAEKYKESELSLANKKLSKALSKGDKAKANKAMKQVKAINKMTEDDIINELLGIYQAQTRGAMSGIMGSLGAGMVKISKTRKERIEHFMDDYKDMSLAELEKVFRES